MDTGCAAGGCSHNSLCASPAASDKPTSASMPMVCAIHMGDSPGLRRPSAVPGQSRHGADKDSQRQNAILASALISGICAIHTGPPPDQHRTASRLPPYRLACCKAPLQFCVQGGRPVRSQVGLRRHSCISQTDYGSRGESWESHRYFAVYSRERLHPPPDLVI